MMIRPSLRHDRSMLVVVSVMALALGFATVSSTPAFADTAGYFTLSATEVKPGDTITGQLYPTMYGATGDFSYFCYFNQAGDSSNASTSGWSVGLVLVNMNSNSIPIVLPSAATGVGSAPNTLVFGAAQAGNLTPNNSYSGPESFTYTIPSTVPDGDYGAFLGCVSPEFKSVAITSDTSEWNAGILQLTVKTPASPTPDTLPSTGSDENSSLVSAGLAAAIMGLGTSAVAIRRRRIIQN